MPTLDDLSTLRPVIAANANDLLPMADISDGHGTGISSLRKGHLGVLGAGFTHAWVVNWNNAELAANTTDDLDESITLMLIPANTMIDKVRIVVTTAFAGLTACNLDVGRTADPNGYIAAASLLAKTVIQNTGVEIDTIHELDVITAADQYLLLNFDPGTNTQALGTDLTAGQVVILVSMHQIADYANLVAAT